MVIDAERQEQAKEYARIQHRLFALDLILSAVALLVVLFGGLSVWLRDTVLSISTNAGIATALYLIVGLGAYGLLYLPLTYYSGFVLQHRYGLSTQTLRAWLIDMLKGAILAVILGTIVIEMIYFLLRTTPNEWWLIASAFMLLFNVVLANLAPVLIFPIFFKFKPLEDVALVQRLTALAERAHTRVRGVYTMMLSEKTTAANAALMGLGNTRRIVLGDTLYQNYSPDEIETILAHELGHHVHHDIAWGLIVESALMVVGFYIADLFLKWSVAQFHYDGIADLASFPLLAIAIGVFGLITLPLGNAYSRWRESLADDYALQTTRNAPAFIGAMEKLANQNLAELEPEPWVEFLLYDHPPIGKRLKRASASLLQQE
jgi:STE24 endopeptidase